LITLSSDSKRTAVGVRKIHSDMIYVKIDIDFSKSYGKKTKGSRLSGTPCIKIELIFFSILDM